MKILYVVHQFFPECFSGTEQYCLAVTREALRRGHDARVLSLDPNLGKDREALRVVRRDYDGIHVDRMQHWWGLLPNDTLRDYHNPLVGEMFRRVLREFQPDVVHVFHVRNLGADFLQIAKDEGCRLVVHLMDFWFLCPEFTLRRTDGTLCEGPPDGGLGCVSCHVPRLGEVWQDPKSATIARELALEGSPPAMHWSTVDRFTALMQRPEKLRKALGLADAVIAPSLFLRDMFVKNGFDASSIEVMAYGLQPDRVERREVTRPRDPLRVTFGGVLSPWKGPHLVVEAVRSIEGPIELSVRGRLEEPVFQDYIDGFRNQAAGDDRISFPGAFDHAELSSVLADTDLLVVPSTWYENTPFVMLEAFAAGVPVLVSDLGGMSEIVEEGVNGFTFRSGDSEDLRAKIEAIRDDRAFWESVDVREPSTIATNLDRLEVLYASDGIC